MKGMSDWNLTELEDIDWEEFGKSDDHIVPRRGTKLSHQALVLSGSNKKLRDEMKNDVGKNMYSKGSATKTVVLGKEDAYHLPTKAGSSSLVEGSNSQASNLEVPDCNAKGIAWPSYDVRNFDYCVDESISGMSADMFCSKDPRLGTRLSKNDDRSGLSSLNGMSSDVTDLSFLGNEQKQRDHDLVYYDWPVLSNFEEIDEMLSWDSTFGQGQVGTSDDHSWFPSSSNTNFSSEIAFEPGLHSPSSELGALHTKLEPNCLNTRTDDHDKPCSSNYADGSDTIAQSKACSANEEKKEGQQSLEEKGTKQSTDQLLLNSDASSLQMYSSQQFSQQKHLIGSSSYVHNSNLHSQLEFGLPTSVEFGNETQSCSSYKVSDNPMNHPNQYLKELPDQLYIRIMASQGNIEKPYQQHQHSFQTKASSQEKQLENNEDAKMENVDVQLPTFEMDHQTQETSDMNSNFSHGASEKAPSFQQLQDTIHQLDVRTKLCIRDSLYRLARSARQRHCLTTQNCSGGTSNTFRKATEASSKTADFIDVETDTNPIDRSIAHLLFHRPSEPATRSVEDTRSLESQIMNQQLHAHLGNQVSAPNQFDQQRLFGGCSDMDTGLHQ